ncbi:4-phosphoerythronate dehydrogenase [Porticoccaceae bacterium LTM1]|nr:4-phosphoerythronate dehydrogenase [Porticoccaceae bacterium LTM1]
MKIVADENMPLVRELFGRFGEVVCLPGREIQADDLRDADALLVRSITKVNRQLLEGSRVGFVGTATIGVDHVDADYLKERDIEFTSAPGCNANAVVDYVFSALCAVEINWQALFSGEQAVGIIGCGNVGGRLHKRLRKLGVRVHCYDPFLTAADNPDLTDLQTVLDCSVISMHTPLTKDGPHPTFHMLSESQLAQLKPGTVLINAGRGPAIDNEALLQCLQQGVDIKIVLDVWEAEPEVPQALMDCVAIATPHIAGYSVQGKTNGTRMVYEAFRKWNGAKADEPKEGAELAELTADSFCEAILGAYNICQDDSRMRSALQGYEKGRSVVFDRLRKEYPQRNEFSCYRLSGGIGTEDSKRLKALGFELS